MSPIFLSSPRVACAPSCQPLVPLRWPPRQCNVLIHERRTREKTCWWIDWRLCILAAFGWDEDLWCSAVCCGLCLWKELQVKFGFIWKLWQGMAWDGRKGIYRGKGDVRGLRFSCIPLLRSSPGRIMPSYQVEHCELVNQLASANPFEAINEKKNFHCRVYFLFTVHS